MDEIVLKLGSDVSDIAYKLSFLEEDVARLNSYIEDIKEKDLHE